MKNLIKNSVFIRGFLCGLPLFIFLTSVIEWDNKNRVESCYACEMTKGFPFAYYNKGVLVGTGRLLWFGLIADILIAIVFSLVIGLIFKVVWEKFTAKRLK